MKQLVLSKIPKKKTFFGGSFLKKSHAKTARPISTKLPMHIVLKSSRAKGIYSFLFPKNQKIVKSLLKKTAHMFHIQIMEFSNNGNHLHLLIKGHSRLEIKNFIRTLSALLPRYIQNRHKGCESVLPNSRMPFYEKEKTISFWDQRAFSRIVESFKGYCVVRDYVLMNQLESLGVIPYQSRKTRNSSA